MKSKGLAKDEIKPMDVPRFWRNVHVRGARQCWNWCGTLRTKQGYGQLGMNRSYYLAHVIAFVLTRFDVAPGMCVLHRCDNPSCVNPNHLFYGTKSDNNSDRSSKGRNGNHQGEANGRAKLTEQNVKDIRRAHQEQSLTYPEIANVYGVSVVAVARICQRKLWSHV